MGDDAADKFFQAVAANSHVESGNKQVAINVARGSYSFGLTDTDDAIVEIEAGHPVKMIFPDQGDNQSGTLFNSVPDWLSPWSGKIILTG